MVRLWSEDCWSDIQLKNPKGDILVGGEDIGVRALDAVEVVLITRRINLVVSGEAMSSSTRNEGKGIKG